MMSVAALVACLVHVSPAAAIDAAHERGKQIYLQGTSAGGGTINAIVGDEAVMLPGAALPCANCHGYDGLGRPEGGVLPPDVRWSQLVKSYGHVHENGRRHPAFDEDSLARSLRAGVDSADNVMDRAMPLYQMSEQDMADLIAYMKYLENDLDPGVQESRVQVASLLPLQGRAGAVGQAMAQVMHAHFADINEQGGVFGRRIELLTVPTAESPEASIDNLRQALAAEGIFALVGAYSIGLDDELLTVLRTDGAPLVGPFTLDPGDAFVDAAAFYLYSGFDEQGRVLADRALAEVGNAKRILVAAPGGERQDRLVNAVQDQLRRHADNGPEVERYAPGSTHATLIADRIGSNSLDAIIFLGGQDDLQALLAQLDARELAPRIYVISSFVSRPLFDAPQRFDQRLFIAYPTFSSDITAEGRAAYQDLAERHALPRDHIQAQIAAFAAAKLLVEGLRRAGRDLSRERFVAGMEELYTFQTGLTPPLTYGPNRRIGARGAHVLAVDLVNRNYTPVGDGWHEIR